MTVPIGPLYSPTGKKTQQKTLVMFSNTFCFLFSKTYFLEYNEKTIFLYF